MVDENISPSENADESNPALQATDQESTSKAEIEESPKSCMRKVWTLFVKFLNDNSFVVEIIAVIILAYIYPPLGAEYLAPQVTASWIAVVLIFGKKL